MKKDKASFIPILFIVFIVTFIAIDSIYIYVAKSTYSGVYTKDHYQKGIDYAKANASGLVGEDQEVEVDGKIAGSKMNFQVKKLGQEFDFDEVKIKAIRPVNDKDDRLMQVQNRDKQAFSVDLGDLDNGQWELRVKVSKSGQDYYNKFRVIKRDSKIWVRRANKAIDVKTFSSSF